MIDETRVSKLFLSLDKCNFYTIFHSIVQTNMKLKFVSWLSSSTTIKQYIRWFS